MHYASLPSLSDVRLSLTGAARLDFELGFIPITRVFLHTSVCLITYAVTWLPKHTGALPIVNAGCLLGSTNSSRNQKMVTSSAKHVWDVSWVESHSPKRCASPKPRCLWMSPYLETESLQMLRLIDRRSLRWAVIQYDWCPFWTGNFGDRDGHAQKEDVKTDRTPGTSQGILEATRNWESGMGQILPRSLEKKLPYRRLDLGLQPPEPWEICWCHSPCGV